MSAKYAILVPGTESGRFLEDGLNMGDESGRKDF